MKKPQSGTSLEIIIAICKMNKKFEFDGTEASSRGCCWIRNMASQNRHHQRPHQTLQHTNPVTQQLNEMSQEERQYIMEDIHGVADKKIESPSFIQEHLELFELSIGKVKGTERVAYDLAMSMNPSYVQNKEFRLMFLRADEFIVHNATSRIMIHFKYKLELFGKEKLAEDIVFDDLSIDVQNSLYTGAYQFLRDKDTSGRTVVFVFTELNVPCTWQNFARARWYHYMVALENESSQQHGIVIVAFWNERSVYSKDNMRAVRVIREAIPLRIAALHSCFINFNMLSSQLITIFDAIGKKLQIRFRSHVEDSTLHCLYMLQTFGINPKSVPLETNERPHKKWYLKFLEERKVFERQKYHQRDKNKTIKTSCSSGTSNHAREEDTINVIDIVPTSADVILGRGVKFSGNTFLDDMIDLDMESYKKAPTYFDKTCITLTTIRRVQASGGRFLKKKKNKENNIYEWVLVDDDEAHRSVADRFRKRVKRSGH